MKNFLILALFGLLAIPAWSQTTAVTAQILDPTGKPYSGAQVNISFVPSPTATTVPLINGSVFNTTVPVVQADSFGNFTTTLIDNALVSDGHTGGVASKWAFFIRSASVCFTGNTVGFSDTLTITGASQNVTASLQAAAATLPSCGGGGSGNVTGCTTPNGIAFQNGTNNTLTCNSSFTVPGSGGGLNSAGLAIQVTPTTEYGASFTNQGTIGNSPTFAQIGNIGNAVITINSPNITNANVGGIIGFADIAGSGTFNAAVSGVSGTGEYDGTGTVNILAANEAGIGGNTSTGTVIKNIGYYSDDQSNVGITNYDFYADPTTPGAGTNYSYYSAGGISVFDQVQSLHACNANGTAANPSVASCSAATAGMFSCATNASTGTCQINTTAVTAKSVILITQDSADGGAAQLNVTCNTGNVLNTTKPLLLSKNPGTSFTINLGTVTANPACFEYSIIN
jgi:hypothetical protein